MLNAILSVKELFLLSLISFVVLFLIRHLFIRRKIFIFIYHFGLFIVLFVSVIGGGGVQNSDYERLEKFILLEKNNELENAKQNPENYDPSLRIDLWQFKNSKEFRDYIKKWDESVDRTEALFIGWVFAFLSDVAFASIYLIRIFLTRYNKFFEKNIE